MEIYMSNRRIMSPFYILDDPEFAKDRLSLVNQSADSNLSANHTQLPQQCH